MKFLTHKSNYFFIFCWMALILIYFESYWCKHVLTFLNYLLGWYMEVNAELSDSWMSLSTSGFYRSRSWIARWEFAVEVFYNLTDDEPGRRATTKVRHHVGRLVASIRMGQSEINIFFDIQIYNIRLLQSQLKVPIQYKFFEKYF